MEDTVEYSVLQSISHWGLIDTAANRFGTLTIVCDYDGNPKHHYFETAQEVMPLMLVVYEKRGMLAIMGNHETNVVSSRAWFPEKEGAEPPDDAFTSGRHIDKEPRSETKH